MKRFGSGISVSGAMVWFAVSYAGAVLGFLGVNAVAARWLGPADFGLFVAAIAAAGLLGQIGLVGSHRSGLREVARLRDVNDPLAMGTLRNGVRAVNLTTLPAVGLLGGVATWILASEEGTYTRVGLALAIMLLVNLCGQQQLWANYIRGLGLVRFASLLEGRSGGALVASLQGVFVLLAWVLFSDLGLVGALMAVAAGFVIPVAAGRATVEKRWRGLTDPQPQLWRDLQFTIRRDWRFLSAQVATYLNVSTEIWIAAVILTNADASMFSAGQRLALLLLLPLTALQVVLAPVIARGRRGDGTDPTLERLLRTAASVATVMCLVLALPLVIAPGFAVDFVFGPGFRDAVPVLLLLACGSIGNVVTGTAGTTLSMLGREGVAAQVQWTGALLRLGVGIPAAYFGGLNGLTLSALVVSVFIFVAMWWRARRAVGLFTHATLRPELSLLRRTQG